MPINIYTYDEKRKSVAWLCEGDWSLAGQIPALEEWLKEKRGSLQPGSYAADVGFKWRRDAACGGPTFSPEAMKTMADLGIWLFLSEYPGFLEEAEEPIQPPQPTTDSSAVSRG